MVASSINISTTTSTNSPSASIAADQGPAGCSFIASPNKPSPLDPRPTTPSSSRRVPATPGQRGNEGDTQFAQIGLQLGIGLFDRVHVGAVRRQISQFGSGRVDELLDPGSLVARQIVHDDDVALRVGTRHFSTHSSNEAALIGRSKAFCATRPRRRRPATSVTVL